MNKPLPENFLHSELAKIVKQFEPRPGCSEGDSAINDAAPLVEPAPEDEAGWQRYLQERSARRVRKNDGSFVEGNEFDGDGGREHSDYMRDNGR